MTRISRRQFLAVVLAGIVGVTGFYAYENDYRDLIVSVLHKRLSHLNLDEVDLHAFADEYEEDVGTYGFRGHLLALGYPIIEHLDFLNIKKDEVEKFEYRVVSRFLLSTDFFFNGADVSRPVRYLVYNNPHQVGCQNPFAQLD